MTSTGPKCLIGGIVTTEEAPRAHHHHLPGVAQVAGQEDDQPDLGELGRLEDEQTGDAHAQVGAVGLVADTRQAREESSSSDAATIV